MGKIEIFSIFVTSDVFISTFFFILADQWSDMASAEREPIMEVRETLWTPLLGSKGNPQKN